MTRKLGIKILHKKVHASVERIDPKEGVVFVGSPQTSFTEYDLSEFSITDARSETMPLDEWLNSLCVLVNQMNDQIYALELRTRALGPDQ